jgi:hypothetical protein
MSNIDPSEGVPRAREVCCLTWFKVMSPASLLSASVSFALSCNVAQRSTNNCTISKQVDVGHIKHLLRHSTIP